MTPPETNLDVLERDLRETLQSPTAEVLASLCELVARAMRVSRHSAPDRLAKLLTQLAFQIYVHGERPALAIEPISLAVILTQSTGSRSTLRLALSVQGLVLGTVGRLSAGLSSLNRALEIAIELKDNVAEVAAWLNIAAVYSEAYLYRDSADAALTAATNAKLLPPSQISSSFLTRAYHFHASAMMCTNEFALAIPLFESALASAPASSNAEEQAVLCTIQSDIAQCLVRLEKTREAAQHIDAAVAIAEACGTFRAQHAADLAVGLQRVYAGDAAKGLQTLEPTLEATAGNRALYETSLRTCIAAYERAGRPERALELNRTLIRLVVEARLASTQWAIDSAWVGRSSDSRNVAEAFGAQCARTRTLLMRPWRGTAKDSPPSEAQGRSIPERLRQLRTLLDDGLITADEYSQRRGAILNEV